MYQSASENRLQGRAPAWEIDPNLEWQNDATAIAARAAQAVKDDPVLRALLTAKTMGEQGCRGLRYRSLVELDGDDSTSQAESDLRLQIERIIDRTWTGTGLDASGMATRRELEIGLSEVSAVSGESFAVRCWFPGRPHAPFATCWRVLRRDRIDSPSDQTDGPTLYRGIALDANGAPRGIWIIPPKSFGYSSVKSNQCTFVPWYDDNGLPNVIHRIGERPLGSYRGLSKFSPLLYLAAQIKAMLDAYVVAKRIQACHPIFIKCEDPNAAAKKDRNGAVWGPNTTLEPGKVYYVGPDAELFFPSWAFNGQDMQAFIDTLYRNQFAAWGLPIDVVLAQLGKTNMAASRSAWLQYYRQCEKWQDDHIEQVTSIIDMCAIQEAILLGELSLPTDMTVRDLMRRGRYLRPPRSMPDPKKEADAVSAWAALGRDLSGLFAESGVDFRDSIAQREEDDRWMAEHSVTITGNAAPAQPATSAPANDAPSPDDNQPEPSDTQGTPDAPSDS